MTGVKSPFILERAADGDINYSHSKETPEGKEWWRRLEEASTDQAE